MLNCALIAAQQPSTTDSITRLIQKYHYKQAIELINTQLDQNDEDVKLFYLKGLAYKGLQKFPEAIYAFERALRRDSANFQTAWELGNCYKAVGYYQQALKVYEKASELNPDNPQTAIERAGILTSLEQYSLAMDIYMDLYQKDTINIFIIRNIAKLFDNMDLTDSAGMYYEKAIKLYPNDFQSVFRLANIYIKQDRYSKAIEITDRFRILNKNNVKVNRVNAYAYYLAGKFPLSAFKFGTCLQAGDTISFSLKYLGMSYFKMEKYDSARVYLARSFIKDSLNAQTCYILGILAKLSGAFKESADYLNKTLKIVSPEPKFESEVLQNLAESYNKNNQFQKGLQALLDANRVTPQDTLLKFRIAVQYDEHFKNKSAALKFYKEFMKTRPQKKDKKESDRLSLSYYAAVEKRIKELSEK